MDKRQFFESLISPLSDNSGQRFDSTPQIQEIFSSLKSNLSNKNLRNEFDQLANEILFHVWMFEQICNGETTKTKSGNTISGPLIVISVSGEILFVNRTYCYLSGLSPSEIQLHSRAGTLYAQVYDGENADRASEAVSRLQSGQGYKHLELFMKHSGRRIAWNSYGGVGKFLEIRSGREIYDENSQEKERGRFYRGSIMNSTRLLENLYQVSIHGGLSAEDEQKLMWIQEFLSMFDFLWNHSELFMEIVEIPKTQNGKIYGYYNTVYAQFFKYSFEEQKKFKDIFSIAHGATISKFFETRIFKNTPSVGEYVFHQYNKCPVAEVYWQCSTYPDEMLPEYKKIFSMGLLVRRLNKKNLIVRFFQSLFRK